MTYATPADLQAVIPDRDLKLLTDWDGIADTIDETKLQEALDDATAEINGYIAKRASLPLSEPPRMLLVVARDLAVYRLFANAGRVTETQEKLRDAGITYLEKVADGELSIGDETGGDEEPTSPGVVMEEGPERVMTRESLERF
ncbi:MAG: DUF1320 domain-containing protein [Dinoroseobacter sp.]|nr:DUF1320 domain-containing protein [Dinoroseobacter sp.]